MLGHVLKWASLKRLPYRTVGEKELTKVAGTTHHEGIIMIAKEKEILSPEQLKTEPLPLKGVVLALESVSNPHNLGAIFRTSAFFGVSTVILAGRDSPRRLNPSIMRTSQGGVEELRIIRTDNLALLLAGLKKRGFIVVGTDVFGKEIYGISSDRAPTVLIMGSEQSGMSPKVRDMCHRLVRIPSRGSVESLNVSVACGVFIALFGGLKKENADK